MGKTDTHVFRHGPASRFIFGGRLIPDGDGIREHGLRDASTFLYPNVLCQLQRKRTWRQLLRSTETRCWSIYQIKSTHPRARSLISSISGPVYCSTMLGDESRAPKSQTVNASHWRVPGNPINHRAQNETFCPLSSLSTSPAPLFWGILFYLGWWRVRIREIQTLTGQLWSFIMVICLHADSHHWTASSLIRELLHLFRPGIEHCAQDIRDIG